MKTLLTSLLATSLLLTSVLTFAKSGPQKDTLSLKCMLYSANLFYGMELGEKPLHDMVDTLVSEVPYFDSTNKLNLVILSAKDLGFTAANGLLWDDILDSAEARGYQVCPAQVAPEIYMMTQNMESSRNLIKQKMPAERPIFVGMDRIRHHIQTKGLLSIFTNKKYFDYVFCIKANAKKTACELGYSPTNSVNNDKSFGWSNNDLFIFVNKPKVDRTKGQICKN